MSRSKKKPAAAESDTVTFKKSELISKLEAFLADNDACDGDWLTKVKTEFLGMKEKSIDIEVMLPCSITIDMPVDKTLTKEQVIEHLKNLIDEGTEWYGWDIEDSAFEVKSFKIVNDSK